MFQGFNSSDELLSHYDEILQDYVYGKKVPVVKYNRCPYYNEDNHYWIEGDDVYREETISIGYELYSVRTYKNDLLHCLNGRSAEFISVDDGWEIERTMYYEGKLHCLEGPAVEYRDYRDDTVYRTYYIDGEKTEREYFQGKVEEYKKKYRRNVSNIIYGFNIYGINRDICNLISTFVM